MRVRGPQGERSLPVEDLFRLPGDTPHLEHTLLPGELIVEVRVPGGDYSRRARYLKVRDRASYEFALVSTAAALVIENGVIRQARLAVGGVGTRPWRLRDCEAALAGRKPEKRVFEEAAKLAIQGARPLQHNHYKLELLPRTIVRALELAGEVA
jgi:xanthine dehydrogenase YagS FAD-binding subunit